MYNWGMTVNNNTIGTIFENLTILGSRMCLHLPFFGMILKWWGVEGVHS